MTDQTMDWAFCRPQRRVSLAEQMHQQICWALQAGAYTPLDRISVRGLAKELGVSVTPVREATLRLISDDILQVNSKGAVIVPVRSWGEITEIFEIRRLLEGELAARAAKKISDEEISYLKETQDLFLEALAAEDYKKVLRMNSFLHFCIYRCGDLPVRLKIVERFWLLIGPTLRHMYPLLRRKRGRGQHENIIDAARMRDPEKLRIAVTADLETSERVLNQYYADCRGSFRGSASNAQVV